MCYKRLRRTSLETRLWVERSQSHGDALPLWYMVSVLSVLLNALQPALHAAIHLVGVEKHCFSAASNQYTGLAARAWAERHVGGEMETTQGLA